MSDPSVKVFDEFMGIWVEEFGRAVEMFTGEKATLSYTRAAAEISAVEISERSWWKQTVHNDQSFRVWAGALPTLWSVFGEEATFSEMLSQANQGVAAVLSAGFPLPLRCEDGVAEAPNLPLSVEWAQISVSFRGSEAGLISLLLDRTAFSIIRPQMPAKDGTQAILSRLLDLHLPVSILLGRARISIREALKLMPGSVIELDRQVGEYVEIMVHGTVVAKGEIVSVKGNYGVRIKQVVSREERLALRDAA